MAPRGRRQILAAGGALVALALAARAQQARRVPRVGFVSPLAPGARDEAFLQGMQALGYAEGRNVEIVMRFAGGRTERLPALTAELVGLPVDVLVVGSTVGAQAAQRATATIPVVFASSSDPVDAGLVANLARPGGNLTGTSTAYSDGFAGKWLDLLKEVAPAATNVAVIWSGSNSASVRYARDLEAAAAKARVRLDVRQASNARELDDALATIARSGAHGLIVTPSPFASSQQARLIGFAADRRLPAIYYTEGFAESGGLMSYGPSIVDGYRRTAAYVDRILKGAKPGELPVEQPTTFELVVNRSAAKAIGLAIPRALEARADRVID